MLRLLKGLYFWLALALVTVIYFMIVLLTHAAVVLLGRPRDGRAVHRVCTFWGRTLLSIVPGWSIKVEGKENLPAKDQPVVVVANHESMADIWAMYYLGIQFRWLSKESVFKYPVIGIAMRLAGYVPVKRGNRESHTLAMQESAARLKQGLSMFFFPEGTRSPDGVIKTFKSGAFRLARDSNVPILPVAIHGAGQLLPKGSLLPGKACVRVKILPIVRLPATRAATAERPDKSLVDLDAVANDVREKIITAHATLL